MAPQLQSLLDRLEVRGRVPDSLEAQRLHRSVRARLLDATVPETRIDRYVITRRLGVGGMGVVYAAFDSALDREVAIKLVRNPSANDGDLDRQRWIAEARALAQLAHPNVVSIYDVGLHESRVFIAMELVRGKTLRQWSTEPRTWEAIVDVYLQAAAGLAAVHRGGLVHRDFKPDSALIDDATSRVRVVDFGLALGHDADTANRTHADARADQFGFCAALWEALFAERPFTADGNALRTGGAAAGVPRVPPDPDRAPPWLRDVLARGLADEPSRRWPSMDALVAACRRR